MRVQHGVITWWQLIDFGYTPAAIKHRVATGRLIRLWPGVYAVGRRELSPQGRWKAATLACGDGYALDGESGMALYGVRGNEGREIEVAGPGDAGQGLAGIRSRRVRGVADHIVECAGIPVLSLPLLLANMAPRLGRDALEAAINEADKKDLIHVGALRAGLEPLKGRRGVREVRRMIDVATFKYTDSGLERAMRPIFKRVRLGTDYLTQEWVNGYRVDFYFPHLDLVIETDGGRFHRTALQQRKDRRRDHAHTRALTPHLRFTHGQVRYERPYVEEAISDLVGKLLARVADSGRP